MTEHTIRPTAKFLKAGTVAIALIVLALEIAYFALWRDREGTVIIPIVAPLLFIWPGVRWLRRNFTKAIIVGDRMRYETGVVSKTTRTIQLSRLQDVRVDQGLWQRIFNIGNISLETSGETSRLTMRNIDGPQAVADDLLNRSQHGV